MGHTKRRVALLLAMLTLAAAKPAAGFLVDMNGHWAAPLVAALEARGIVSGDEYLRFNPEAALTRAQLSKLLVTGLGSQSDAKLLSAYPSRFRDVPKWHWANGYIESLAETGAVQGYADGGFGPEDAVTRAQLAVIFVREAGLTDLARMRQFEDTGYADNDLVPDWARGAVQVARDTGLLTGFADNTFRPLQPVTRAEASVVLFRMLSTKGRTFHLTGTLMQIDADSLTAVIRDPDGEDHSIAMAPMARYFRSGQQSYINQMRKLDQVWVVLGPDGTGAFMDARYEDLVGTHLRVSGSTVSVTLPSGLQDDLKLQPGATVFLNGHPATPAQVNNASDVYAALDRITGEVRVLDALTVTAAGPLVNLDPLKGVITIQLDADVHDFRVAPDLVCILNGEKVNLVDLQSDDTLKLVQNPAGLVVYVMAER